jgi:hypothetical protein
MAAFLSPTKLCAGNIGWITSYLYTRYPLRPGDTYDYYYRPNITTLYVGQTIDVLMTVYDASPPTDNVLNFYIDGSYVGDTIKTWNQPNYSGVMYSYAAVTPGVQKLYAHIKDDMHSWLNYDEIDITVLQGPAPAATITADNTSITLGQSTTIRANFSLPGGDPAVGSNIDLGAVGTPAPGQDGSAQPSRTYTFTPTAGGYYSFYADIKTGYRDWTNYSGYYHSYADATGDHYQTGGTYVTVTVTAPVSISSQPPASQTVASGAGATISVVGTGYPSPTFQWQVSKDLGVTWSNVSGTPYSGTTNPTLNIGPQTSTNSGWWYHCVVSNGTGSPLTSTVSVLNITPGPFDTASTVPTLPPWALASLIGVVFFIVKATLPKHNHA